MKANEAPEKIYLDIEPNLDDCTWHLTNPNGDSVEYIRTKEVDLENEIDLIEDKYHGFESLSRADIIDVAKHFFELGLFSQLTWQDIRLISEIGEDFMNSEESDDLWKDEEVYYTAILNKLKEKGRDYKTERQITRELEQKGEEV